MASIRHAVRQAVTQGVGSTFWITKTITSSAITVAAQNLTSNATGKLLVKQIIIKTDATGLAGGTNFQITTTNAKGAATLVAEAIASLGANLNLVLAPAISDADTTSDVVPGVTDVMTVLEAGKKLQYNNTVAAGTGAGTIDVHILFERMDDGASLTAG